VRVAGCRVGADGHVIEQQDCMGIRAGGGSERVGRVGNFLIGEAGAGHWQEGRLVRRRIR
jgi:hypothetical protein